MTTKNHIIIVYGSLKKGKCNHDLLEGQEYLGNTVVHGVMQLNGSYPYLFDSFAVKRPGKNHSAIYDAEVYRVDDATYRAITAMELGAGYYEREISTDWGMGIAYYTQPRLFSKSKEVIKEY